MEERVAVDPLDADAWVVLLAEASEQGPPDFRPLYERCVAHFPSAACVWYQWLEAELRSRQIEPMEGIFERCLLRCPHVELWRLYLSYLRHEKQTSSKELLPAYELLLQAVGTDVNAGSLWNEYVGLLCENVEPGMMPMSGPVTAAREAYQRALVQPAMGLEAMWKDYEKWEAAQSGPQAKQLLAEIADRALVARRVARERAGLAAPLKLNRMPRVPRGTPAEVADLANWRAMWMYEAANPRTRRPAPRHCGGACATAALSLVCTCTCARSVCVHQRPTEARVCAMCHVPSLLHCGRVCAFASRRAAACTRAAGTHAVCL